MDTFVTNVQHLTADQYRARVQIVRSTADKMTGETIRQQLLDIAAQYERLADSMERERLGKS
jgi:hypothetical protein